MIILNLISYFNKNVLGIQLKEWYALYKEKAEC